MAMVSGVVAKRGVLRFRWLRTSPELFRFLDGNLYHLYLVGEHAVVASAGDDTSREAKAIGHTH